MPTARRRGGDWLWLAAIASLAVSLTPWASIVLYPFKLFTTWVHECGHALMTVIIGGTVRSVAIEPDTSGLTLSFIPAGRLAGALVASAGYLGAALVGCALLAATRVARWAPTILLGLGVCMLLTLLFWVRNPFGIAVVLAWTAVLIASAWRGVGNMPRFFLSLVAIQVALNAVYDIRVLFLIDRGRSDAATMARLLFLPSWAWATVWMGLSVAMLTVTLRTTSGRR